MASEVGDDVWVAFPGRANADAAETTVRFASLTDCQAEPTGIYFDKGGTRLFINADHRGGNAPGSALPDLGMVIEEAGRQNR